MSTLQRRTERQKTVLRALAHYGMMTYEQLADALDSDYQPVNRIAKRLRDRGEIATCRWIDEDKTENKEAPITPFHVCALSHAGVKRLIDQGYENDTKNVTVRSWNGRLRKLPHYEHDREVVNLLISLRKSLASANRYSGVKTHVATSRKTVIDNGEKKHFASTYLKMSDDRYIIPDAILQLKNQTHKLSTTAFLEFERYDKKNKVPKRQVQKLINYRSAIRYQKRDFLDDQYLLLYVVSNPARVTQIFTSDEAVPLFGVLRVAKFDDVIADPLGSIWKRANVESGKLKLIDWSLVNG